MTPRALSPLAAEALHILGMSVRAARLRRRWSIDELAERTGVSRPTIVKIERGDPGVAVGTVLEAAVLVGVPLFEPDGAAVGRYAAQKQAELALLPSAGRRATRAVDDDF